MRRFEAKQAPLKIQYRYRPQEYGENLVRMYLLTNNEDSKLGTTPLPDGVVRRFPVVEEGEQPAGVEDHLSPKPRSSSSVRSAIGSAE